MARTTKTTKGDSKKAAAKDNETKPLEVDTAAPEAAEAAAAPAKKPKRKRSKKSAKKKESKPKEEEVAMAEKAAEAAKGNEEEAAKGAALPDPAMWATHQTHNFATQMLEKMFKFTEDRLVALMRDVYGETDGNVVAANVELILGKKPIRIKKIKDPNRPRRPPTAYQLFCRKFHKQAGAGDKPTNLIELSKENSKRWKKLGAGEKEPFQQQAEALKAQYKDEQEAYERKKGDIISKIVVS